MQFSNNVFSYSNSRFCSSDSNSIKVFVRVRPLTHGTGLTTDGDQGLCLTVTSPSTIRLLTKPEPRTFTYDHVADVDTSQVCSTHVVSHVSSHASNSETDVVP